MRSVGAMSRDGALKGSEELPRFQEGTCFMRLLCKSVCGLTIRDARVGGAYVFNRETCARSARPDGAHVSSVSLSGSTRRLGFASESSSWSAHETIENESRVLWRSPAGASEIGCSGDSAGDATQGQISPHWQVSPQQEGFECAATLIDAPAIDPVPKRGATQPSALNSTARIVAVMCTERARIGSENLRSTTLSRGRDRSAERLKDVVNEGHGP